MLDDRAGTTAHGGTFIGRFFPMNLWNRGGGTGGFSSRFFIEWGLRLFAQNFFTLASLHLGGMLSGRPPQLGTCLPVKLRHDLLPISILRFLRARPLLQCVPQIVLRNWTGW